MMEELMGIIYQNEQENYISHLHQFRCPGATPFGGKYRLIDFVLTNMTEKGIGNIAVLFTSKYRPLMNHLQDGKHWGLKRKRDGLFNFLPTWNMDDVELCYQNLDHFFKSSQTYTVLAPANIVGQLNLSSMLANFKESSDDIHTLCSPSPPQNISINQCQPSTLTLDTHLNVFMLKTDLFIDLILAAKREDFSGFIPELISKYADNLSIQVVTNQAPLAKINSLEKYFYWNLSLLTDNHNILLNPPPCTKQKDLPPTEFGSNSQVDNSLIADGCQINGRVVSSIIFHSVTLEHDTEISNSIIFPHCSIKRQSNFKNTIIDKQVTVSEQNSLQGYSDEPLVISKKVSL